MKIKKISGNSNTRIRWNRFQGKDHYTRQGRTQHNGQEINPKEDILIVRQ